jgi:hypothetical protein
MHTYILILSMIAGDVFSGNKAAAPAITMQEFSSRESCLTAANLWLSQVNGHSNVRMARAACVEK